jgi:hypothetical protein
MHERLVRPSRLPGRNQRGGGGWATTHTAPAAHLLPERRTRSNALASGRRGRACSQMAARCGRRMCFWRCGVSEIPKRYRSVVLSIRTLALFDIRQRRRRWAYVGILSCRTRDPWVRRGPRVHKEQPPGVRMAIEIGWGRRRHRPRVRLGWYLRTFPRIDFRTWSRGCPSPLPPTLAPLLRSPSDPTTSSLWPPTRPGRLLILAGLRPPQALLSV